MIFERLRNLWALSDNIGLKRAERQIPKGMASVVDITSTPEEDFPQEEEV